MVEADDGGGRQRLQGRIGGGAVRRGSWADGTTWCTVRCWKLEQGNGVGGQRLQGRGIRNVRAKGWCFRQGRKVVEADGGVVQVALGGQRARDYGGVRVGAGRCTNLQ